MSWNNGYVSDIEYGVSFSTDQSPVHLNFLCLLQGYEPRPLEPGFTYCELGCGRALTANILAAANPQGRFYAFDFMPAHVAEGRELAAEAGLDNLVVREDDFAALAAGEVELPMFDFVSMFGVYGWVNAGNREHIVRFLERYVKPGGVVYVNYNTLPGWSEAVPLQKLILDLSENIGGSRQQRCEQVKQTVGRMRELGARYFTEHTGTQMRIRLDSMENDPVSYLAHEYMSDGWHPHEHHNVTRHLASAGFDYAGDMGLHWLLPERHLAPQQRRLLERAPPALRELTQDLLIDNSFRQDVYIRDAQRLTPERAAYWEQRYGLARIRPQDPGNQFKLINCERLDLSDVLPAVWDALRAGPLLLAQLRTLLKAQGQPQDELLSIVCALLSTQFAASCYAREALDSEPARRMNRAIGRSMLYSDSYTTHASPVLGNGIPSGPLTCLAYQAVVELGAQASVEAMVARIEQMLETTSAAGIAPMSRETLAGKMRKVLEDLVPIWRSLHVL